MNHAQLAVCMLSSSYVKGWYISIILGNYYLRWSRGVQIQGNLESLESWAIEYDLQKEATTYLDKITCVAELLATPKHHLAQVNNYILKSISVVRFWNSLIFWRDSFSQYIYIWEYKLPFIHADLCDRTGKGLPWSIILITICNQVTPWMHKYV